MAANNLSISSLDEVVASLPAAELKLLQRIYTVSAAEGELCIPPSMQPWVQQQFGSVESVSQQKVIRVTNKVTGEETLFGRLRALRPIESKVEKNPAATLDDNGRVDLFDDPYNNTPEDTFGRVTGKHCVTASNIAKFDEFHGLIIFNNPDPLDFSRDEVINYIDVAQEWMRRAREVRPEAMYPLFIWNCLWRAGASIHHGHAQVALASGRHYAKIDRLWQAALDYRQSCGVEYFRDLFAAHHSVGCALERDGVKIMAHLTPFKNNEVVLMAEMLSTSLKERVYDVLACFRDRLGVQAFNMSLVTPPLAETEESWEGFPVMVRMVDRGDLGDYTSDVGSMEIYAASVVHSDPFQLTRELQAYFAAGESDG
ncbi:hypothetical protein ACFLYF_00670 [Chloroflexota bacterium]